MGSELIIAREIPDVLVSTRDVSVKYRVSIVSIDNGYATSLT
jgi:hypothetical protein